MKSRQSSAHTFYTSMASLPCEYGCDPLNEKIVLLSKDSVGTDVMLSFLHKVEIKLCF